MALEKHQDMAAPAMLEQPMGQDQLLIQAFQEGDDHAFNQLVFKYRRQVYSVAYRFTQNHEEADDLAQETFVRAYQNLAHFRGEASFKTWLLRITSNLSINHLKSGRISKDVGEEPNESAMLTQHPGLDALVKAEQQQALRQAITQLPPKQKETLMLKTFQDLTCEQVAEIMKCSVGTVKANLFNALKKLKRLLAEEGKNG